MALSAGTLQATGRHPEQRVRMAGRRREVGTSMTSRSANGQAHEDERFPRGAGLRHGGCVGRGPILVRAGMGLVTGRFTDALMTSP